MYKPLADEIRPKGLEDVVGQRHILGREGMLRRVIESGQIPNMIFYGPSGTGKTTVARIIAEQTNRSLRKLNATTAGIADIKRIIDELDTFLTPSGVLLYLDEIQYFNKKQQQSLLEFIEDGRITLIASTTENPYFCVFNAILSRSTVFEFKPVSAADVENAVRRAVDIMNGRRERPLLLAEGAVKRIASACGGDVRKAVNSVELLFSAAGDRKEISLEDAVSISQRSAMRYDRDGDEHFDILSALMKSLRGSDADAAMHYLARLLEVGDLVGACRRILCSASEDIGLAYPQAVPIVKACVDSALQLGLPEARLPLAQACLLLATAPKSNSACIAIDRAMADVRAGRTGAVPRELQNVHADGTGFEREQGYQYPHNFPGHWVKQQYLPNELRNAKYYEYGENKTEQAARRYWEEVKK
ncbi:replication-associated recombination protein A [Dysosmobacter sp.]|uniref:replication-associated recombination protein A n=1 Tax=Dysosmobacter sp. TaxID=2591382 RepID=UPI003AB3CF7D